MSLTSAMETARSSLSVLSERTSVVSRNVANAGNETASRKIAHTVTAPGGVGVRLAAITRVSDDALFQNMITSNSDAAMNEAVVNSLDQIERTIGDTQNDASPAALVGKLADAVQQYAAAPQEAVRGQTAIVAASDLANALNDATDIVQQTRTQADQQIADSVNNLNSLLGQVRGRQPEHHHRDPPRQGPHRPRSIRATNC